MAASLAAAPLGAVLASGRGSRLGGAKATAELGGRPLISYPLVALAAAGIEAVVVAKGDTELPDRRGGRPPLGDPGHLAASELPDRRAA